MADDLEFGVLQAEHFEALRNLPSFRMYTPRPDLGYPSCF